MKEIMRNGPINGEVMIGPAISHYSSGVVTENGMGMLMQVMKDLKHEADNLAQADGNTKQEVSTSTMEERGVEFVKLQHSVPIIGWGVEPGTKQKYWIVRNSYGREFGLSGDFKIQRGQNDFGIEAMATASDFIKL